jgi:hypothetical protein
VTPGLRYTRDGYRTRHMVEERGALSVVR